jgi:hypothetical protein
MSSTPIAVPKIITSEKKTIMVGEIVATNLFSLKTMSIPIT